MFKHSRTGTFTPLKVSVSSWVKAECNDKPELLKASESRINLRQNVLRD